jgi:lipopolysaccharide export LptBFGC system permease protein LptF
MLLSCINLGNFIISEFIAMLSEEKTENLLEQARSESPLLRNSIKSHI